MNISDYLEADIVCCDYVHTISKSQENLTHTNTLNIYFRYSKDHIEKFSDEQKKRIAEIFSVCFKNTNYNWNKVKISESFYQYSLLEHGCCLVPKLNGEKLNIRSSSFEAQYFIRLAENCRKTITDRSKQYLGIDVFYVVSYNNSIVIFIRDEKFESLTQNMKNDLCTLCKKILNSHSKKEYFNTADKLFVVERSSRMIDYR